MADTPNADNELHTDSPSENEITGSQEQDDAVEGSQPQSDSDDSGNSGAEARIRRLSSDKKKLSQEASYWKEVAQRYAQTDAQRVSQYPATQPSAQPDTPPAYANDEVERAYRTLKDRGMVTKEELDQYLVRIEWDRKHDRNEAEVGSRKGLPAYDREEVERHARERGISDPMAAYRDLYFDEILDATKRGGRPTSKPVTTAKPSKPAGDDRQPLDLEGFRAKLNGPKGREFYEKLMKNPQEFDRVMQTLSGSE